MALTEHGTIRNGAVELAEPVALPDGTEVVVWIEPVQSSSAADATDEVVDFATHPSYGMWADREDMQDSVEWVRRLRAQWGRRVSRTSS